MSPNLVLVVYCFLILLASLAGGWIPHLVKLTHVRLQLATSCVAGLMLGVGILHLLPHAGQELASFDRAVYWLMGGFLVMFFIQRFFHFHHHDVPEESPEGVAGCCGHDQVPGSQSRAHEHRVHTLAHKSASRLSWSGAAFGLTLHTLIDGLALAASVEVEAGTSTQAGFIGFGTFLVIILHKPFDALAIATLMTAGGWSRATRHLVNGLFALVIPVGVLLFHGGMGHFEGSYHQFLGAALAFAAGTFVCIAASDLLPELQFHSHDRIKLSVALLAGILLSILVGRFEHEGHDHGVQPSQEDAHPSHAADQTLPRPEP